MSTEDALRDALDQAQQVEKLMEAMRSCPDKAQVSGGQGWADQVGSPEAGAWPGKPGLNSAREQHGFIPQTKGGDATLP